jgi:DNA-binding IclR family transcriptional regulator
MERLLMARVGEISGTIDKALELLFHLHEQPASRGVSELGRALSLPKSTAHRLLASLSRRGLVERDALGRYRPGIALVALGLGVLEREPLVEASRPVLERSAETLGETIFLSGARAGRLYVLDKQEGSGFLRAAPRVGSEIPAHATAIGKVHLAWAPDDVRRADAELARYTPATLVDPAALAREITLVRAGGYAEMRDEWIPGLSGVAAPIRLGARLLGAIALAAPSSHFSGERQRAFRDGVLAAATEIEARVAGGRNAPRLARAGGYT